jgi:hypothetical protein
VLRQLQAVYRRYRADRRYEKVTHRLLVNMSGAADESLISEIVHPTHSILFRLKVKAAKESDAEPTKKSDADPTKKLDADPTKKLDAAILRKLDANWYHKVIAEFRHWPYRESLYWMVGCLFYHRWQPKKQTLKDELAALLKERRLIVESHPEVSELFPEDFEPARQDKSGPMVQTKVAQLMFSRYVAFYANRCAKECFNRIRAFEKEGYISLVSLVRDVNSYDVSLSHLESVPGRLRNLLSWFCDVSLSHIVLQNLTTLKVPGLELNRETLGADISKVISLYPGAVIEEVRGLGEQFYQIDEELRKVAATIYQQLHLLYYFLRCRWLNEVMRLEMTRPVSGVLAELSKVFSPQDIGFEGIRVDSLSWEPVARISAVLTTLQRVVAPKDQQDSSLEAFLTWYRGPPELEEKGAGDGADEGAADAGDGADEGAADAGDGADQTAAGGLFDQFKAMDEAPAFQSVSSMFTFHPAVAAALDACRELDPDRGEVPTVLQLMEQFIVGYYNVLPEA